MYILMDGISFGLGCFQFPWTRRQLSRSWRPWTFLHESQPSRRECQSAPGPWLLGRWSPNRQGNWRSKCWFLKGSFPISLCWFWVFCLRPNFWEDLGQFRGLSSRLGLQRREQRLTILFSCFCKIIIRFDLNMPW